MTKMNRRTFLTGLGASAVAGSLARPWRARAQAATPKRFVFVVSGNGYDAQITMSEATRGWIGDTRGYPVKEEHWWGSGYAEGYYAEDQTSTHVLSGALSGAPGLRAFESAGLLDQCAMVYGLSSMVTGGGHSTGHGVLSSWRTIAGRPAGRPSTTDWRGSRPCAASSRRTRRGSTPTRCPRTARRRVPTRRRGRTPAPGRSAASPGWAECRTRPSAPCASCPCSGHLPSRCWPA